VVLVHLPKVALHRGTHISHEVIPRFRCSWV
jgi:hypothetical protein